MRIAKRIFFVTLVITCAYAVFYIGIRLPYIAGYGAKDLCSCVWLAGRESDDVIKNELGFFPLSLGTYSVDSGDSSATGSVMGMSTHKAIFRKGLGCTLVSELTEAQIRKQSIVIAPTVRVVTDTIAWPDGDRISSVLPSFIDHKKIAAILDDAFAEPLEKKARNLRAVVVVYDGQIIAERYAEGFTRYSRHHGWSMTKSVTNSLVGIMTGEGRLRVADAAPVTEWKNDERRNITLNNLLQATSGLKWWENYGNPSEATTMLFKKSDMGNFTAQQPLDKKPGDAFYYSSGTPNLISAIMRKTLGDDAYYQYPYLKLFRRIGMYSAVIEPDAGGTFVGSSYSFATARDWTRFGLLYLNDGMWNGEQILPSGWVRYSTTPSSAAPIGEYGALFWLNAGAPGHPEKRRYPDAPVDVFGADGYEGQNVWIVPSKKLVITRLSLEHGNFLNENKFLSDIIGTIPDTAK